MNDDDAELFRAAVADARPLSSDRVDDTPPRPVPVPRQRLADERQVLEDMFSDVVHPDDLVTGEELFFARPGLQLRVLRQLRRGQFAIEAELDLHGMTSDIARAELAEFLAQCRQHGHRCLRIIHGKGRRSSNRGPILKGKVDHWLRQRDEVLAFCSARAVDGGSGAVYVLLRRS
jgi:DNA-nicking Smr family endonuclease